MIINHDAVLEVGGLVRGPEVPQTSYVPLSVPGGVDVTIDVYLRYSTGEPVNLSPAGTSLVLTVKRRSSDSVNALELVGVVDLAAGVGRAHFLIEHNMLLNFFGCTGRFIFDIRLTRPGDLQDAVTRLSPFLVYPWVGYPPL